MFDLINYSIMQLNAYLWHWPFLVYLASASIIVTIALRFIQLRMFVPACKALLFNVDGTSTGDMTPLQAFINTLSTSTGNGSLAGVATAIAQGGPGAALWIVVFGMLNMSLRFAEVFLAISAGTIAENGSLIGGPMVYLQRLPAGKYLASLFTFFMLYMSLASGTAMQANSISIGIADILAGWHSGSITLPIIHTSISALTVYAWAVATLLLIFVMYVVRGGAKRVVAISDMLVPFKVLFFFGATVAVLIYHADKLTDALLLIIRSALTPQAVAGGALGFSVQQALRFGVVRSINATEAGLGTAGVLFGGTASNKPYKSALMSMISVFISANLVCFAIALAIISSGAYTLPLESLALTIAAYKTVFGAAGAWIVTALSISFGTSVLVSYSYIARSCWLFLTNGRGAQLFNVLFCLVTFGGAVAKVDIIWNAIDISNAGLLFLNILAILWFLPTIRTALKTATL